MKAAGWGKHDVVKYLSTEYRDVIDINAQNEVSTFDWYVYSCFLLYCLFWLVVNIVDGYNNNENNDLYVGWHDSL